jgi:hypothetical protein
VLPLYVAQWLVVDGDSCCFKVRTQHLLLLPMPPQLSLRLLQSRLRLISRYCLALFRWVFLEKKNNKKTQTTRCHPFILISILCCGARS